MRSRSPAVRLHERLVDERLQLVEDALARLGADGLDVGERAASREDGQPPEQALLRLGRAASGSSRSWRGASAAARGCRAGPTVSTWSAWSSRSSSASGDEEPQPRGGELDRERQAVQPPADRVDGVGVLRRQLERASGRPRALDEQRDRGRRGPVERREREYSRSAAILSGVLLVVTIRSAGQRSTSPATSGAADDELLEVVQEQERLLVADQRGDALTQRALLGLLHVERVRKRGDESARIGHVGQRDERDTVQELGREHPA